ncbi:hypothetical protein CRENBAI_006301 [Crenichthys baileyi]|uniref:Uncharacterized protein n=1 Tax=Crenichthys baileyi TaxID=28760 RepID=A0AAV9RSM9_9TELE
MDQARERSIGFRAGEELERSWRGAGEELFRRYSCLLSSRSSLWERLEVANMLLDWLEVWGGFFPQSPLTPGMVEIERERAEIGPRERAASTPEGFEDEPPSLPDPDPVPGPDPERSVDKPPSHPFPVHEGFGEGLPPFPVPVLGELENELPPLPLPFLEELEDELHPLPLPVLEQLELPPLPIPVHKGGSATGLPGAFCTALPSSTAGFLVADLLIGISKSPVHPSGPVSSFWTLGIARPSPRLSA